jgi:AP endonuclease-1
MTDSPLSAASPAVPDTMEDVHTPTTTATSKSVNGKGKRASAAPLEASNGRAKRVRTSAGPIYKEEDVTEGEQGSTSTRNTPGKSRTPKGKGKSTTIIKAEIEEEEEKEEDSEIIDEKFPKKTTQKRTKKQTVEKTEETEDVGEDGSVKKRKVVHKRKTKEEKEAEAMPIAARTLGSKILIGAHVSSAGGTIQCMRTKYTIRY